MQHGFGPRSLRWGAVAVLACALASVQAAPAGAADVAIQTLSNRADLISGGDAYIGVDLPESVDFKDPSLAVELNGRDVKGAFDRRADGRITGLVTGLRVGANTIEVRLGDGRGARLEIVNHPKGGPVFSGPQVQPWVCDTDSHDLG